MTPLSRRRMYASAGMADPIPSIDDRRAWCWIDNRVPPKGEADGEFDTYVKWLNKASSWIGWTGASCYDAKDRRCMGSGDMMRARDEEAFPVRWYWPERYADPIVVDRRTMRIRASLARSPEGVTIAELRQIEGMKRVTVTEIAKVASGRVTIEGDRIAMNAQGLEQTLFEMDCERHAGYLRN